MKILSKLGSKKIMGAILVMVTLVVGIGVISNFSDNDQKRANESALSQFGDNAYNTFPGGAASRADLERQLSLGQDKNTARFFRGKSEGAEGDDAFSADGAYGEGLRTDEGFVYDESTDYGQEGVQGAQGGTGFGYGYGAAGAGAVGAGIAGGVDYADGAKGAQGGAPGVNGAQGAVAGMEVAGGMVPGQDLAGYTQDINSVQGIKNAQGFNSVQGSEGVQGAITKGSKGGARSAKDASSEMYAKGGAVDANGVPYTIKDSKGNRSASDIVGANGEVDANGVPYGPNGKAGRGSGSAAGVGGAQGGVGMSAAGGAGAGGAQDAEADGSSDAAAKAADRAKSAKERAARNRARRETQINKLASSNGGSSWGSMGGGKGGGSMSAGSIGGDNSSKPLPSTDAMQAANTKSDAFKLGRGGAMGGYNVARANTKSEGNNRKGGEDRSAITALLYAKDKSGEAMKKVSTGMKSTAEEAFIQSESATGNVIEDGASIERAVSQLYDSASHNDPPSASPIDLSLQIQQQRTELEELQGKIKDKYTLLIIGTLILGIALGYVVKLAYEKPEIWYLWVIAAALTIAAFLFIHGLVHGLGDMFGEPGENSILGMINQMDDDEKFGLVNDGIDTDGKRSNAWWTYGSLLFGIGLCWLPWEDICSWFSDLFGGGSSGVSSAGSEASQLSSEIGEEISTKMGGFHSGGRYM